MRTLLSLLVLALVLPVSAWQPAGDPQTNASQTDQYFPLRGKFAASHILIAYRNADKAPAEVTRSKREARDLAEEVLTKVHAEPEKFEDFARQYSDGPTGPVGGFLGAFDSRQMAPAFEKMVERLAIGDIAPEVVRTGFGYHIIRRNDLMVKHYTAHQVLLVHNEALVVAGVRDKTAYQRTKQAAREKLQALMDDLTPENLAAMADKHSDLEGSGGFMGVFKQGSSPVYDAAIPALEELAYGELSEIVELPIGLSIMRRDKVVRLQASQIVIAYAGAENAKPEVSRTKDEARAEAKRLAGLLAEDASQFEDLAKAHSDGLFGIRGGLMPVWFRGYQPAAVEQVVEALADGEVSLKVVESPQGFHLVRRESPE